jgi:hypothetical protein
LPIGDSRTGAPGPSCGRCAKQTQSPHMLGFQSRGTLHIEARAWRAKNKANRPGLDEPGKSESRSWKPEANRKSQCPKWRGRDVWVKCETKPICYFWLHPWRRWFGAGRRDWGAGVSGSRYEMRVARYAELVLTHDVGKA